MTEQTLTPFDEGYLACDSGAEFSANPYGDEAAIQWSRGWLTAEADNRAVEASIGGAAPIEGRETRQS